MRWSATGISMSLDIYKLLSYHNAAWFRIIGFQMEWGREGRMKTKRRWLFLSTVTKESAEEPTFSDCQYPLLRTSYTHARVVYPSLVVTSISLIAQSQASS